MRILPDAPNLEVGGLKAVLAHLVAEGHAEPAWVAVADGSGEWLRPVASLSARQRARGVVALMTENGLVCALRLGVGGAVWMPPSTPAMRQAVIAATEGGRPQVEPDPAVLELAACSTEGLMLVTFVDHGFWRRQLGEPVLASLLAHFAAALPGLTTVLPWPCAVVQLVDRDEVESAWRDVRKMSSFAPPSLEVRSLQGGGGAPGAVAAAYRTLASTPPDFATTGTARTWPVHQLPGGEPVGEWSVGTADRTGRGWWASPVSDEGGHGEWRLVDGDVTGSVPEVLTTAAAADAVEAPALRVPGWAVQRLRPGTPAALLVEALADLAAARGLPLWIPNVDDAGLRFVLQLPGTLWVDGPAVPG